VGRGCGPRREHLGVTRGRWLVAIVATLTLCTTVAPAAAARAPAFVTASLPAAPGTGLATNHDAEPAIAVAPDGRIWATSLVAGRDPRARGQDVWTSADGARTWRWVAAPFNVPGQDPLIGGADADIAVAPERNAVGRFNVYAASLWGQVVAGLFVGDISLAVSSDGGRTWLLHPLAAEVPVDDRPWLAADGPCRVYLTYHAGPTLANVVNTYDLCDAAATVTGLTLMPVNSTRYPALLAPALTGQRATYVTAGFGKTVVDTSARSPFRHRVYIPMMDCPRETVPEEIQRAAAVSGDCLNGERAEVFVLVGRGTSWALRPVAISPDSEVGIWPVTAATDATGRLYLAWHDNHDSWLQSSADGGTTWSAPVRLNPRPSGSAVYPTVAASGDGQVVVSWYGANRAGDANDPRAMGLPNQAGSARWQLRWARSRDRGRHFGAPATVDRLIHTGVLCTKGDACTIPDSRNLLDDFGVTISPRTGRSTIVYTSDQPGGHGADRVTRSAAEVR
jgi:hypothetical protein